MRPSVFDVARNDVFERVRVAGFSLLLGRIFAELDASADVLGARTGEAEAHSVSRPPLPDGDPSPLDPHSIPNGEQPPSVAVNPESEPWDGLGAVVVVVDGGIAGPRRGPPADVLGVQLRLGQGRLPGDILGTEMSLRGHPLTAYTCRRSCQETVSYS